MQALGQHEIPLPVKASFIAFTLIVALLLNMLPWSGAVFWFRPDFVALGILYWVIEQPHRVGFTIAFVLGLLMDVADGALLGQHALAYSILVYGGILFHRRVRLFSPLAQIVHVIPLLLVNDVIILGIRLLAGADFPGYRFFIGSFVGGALWPFLPMLFKLPQRPKADRRHG
jgi:rod shape-determining protein MreD